MKHLVIIGDGMGDYPVPELGDRTPLAAAHTPNLDWLAQNGLVARALTIPSGMEPGSDVANMSILGYDPAIHHVRRGPLEAASIGVKLTPDQVAFRCNLVVLGRSDQGGVTMDDYASGHITSEDSAPLVEALQAELGDKRFRFHPGTSYRHLLVWSQGREDIDLTPPHDKSGQEVGHILEKLKQDEPALYELTQKSWPILEKLDAGPNSIWVWGQSKPPQLPTVTEKYRIKGAVISAVDLIKGLGVYAGLDPIIVPGATGWLDTNYRGKVEAGLAALKEYDFFFLHVEAPDESGHTGVLENKMQAITDFDAKIVGPMLQGLESMGDFRLLLACDHFTPLSVMTHTREKVPLILYDSRRRLGSSPAYTEEIADQGPDLSPAHGLMDLLFEVD